MMKIIVFRKPLIIMICVEISLQLFIIFQSKLCVKKRIISGFGMSRWNVNVYRSSDGKKKRNSSISFSAVDKLL